MANNNNKKKSMKKDKRDIKFNSKKDNERKDRTYAMAGKCWDGPENDPSWYISEETILKDAASLSYANLAGVHYTINQNLRNLGPTWDINNDYIRQEQPQTIPGIMVFEHINTFGQSSPYHGVFDDSALTSMVRALYSYVRHANSGSKNYEAPDLGMYILAVDQVYTFIAELQRVYGVLTLYSRVNRYYGRRLVSAMGFNYDDLSTQIADLRAYINMLVYKASSLAVPANFSVFARHIWLANNYFTDSASGKANIYLFRPCRYGRFAGFEDERGSQIIYDLKWMEDRENDRRLEDIKAMGTALMSPLLNNEDIGIMSGDILKAFGQDNLAKLTLINEDYQVLPVHSLEVLTQIQNLSLPMHVLCQPCSGLNHEEFSTIPKIVQENGVIISNIGMYVDLKKTRSAAALTASGLDRFLSMPMDNPTPSDTMVATRLTNIPSSMFDIELSGSDIDYKRYVAVYDVTGTELITSATIYYINGAISIAQTSNDASDLAALSAFDYHPYVIAWHNEGNGQNLLDGFVFESDNYTVLTKATLNKMHEAAIVGEIFIRSIALAPSK